MHSKTMHSMNSFKQEKQDESLESESAVIPSFRQLLFPMDPVTAANVHISPLSPRLQKDAQKSKRNQNSSQSSIKPRVKTRYELWREGRYKESFKPSLSEKAFQKGSLRFSIGESNIESSLTISALNNTEFKIFEEMEEEHDLAQDKGETFDLSAFLESLKKPRAALRNIKANYIVELKERIETGGSVQDGLSKEECLYYIEAFVSIDVDESGAISEQELFEAMDTLNMDVSIEKVREMIKSVDVNGDGDVSVDEFLTLMAGLRSKVTFLRTQEQLEFAFRLVDRDGDGFVGIQDLMTLYEEIGDLHGEPVDYITCKKMLQSVLGETISSRISEDPKVNFEQFTKLVKAVGQ